MTQKWPVLKLGDALDLKLDSVRADPTAAYDIAGVYGFGRGLLKRGPLSGSDTTYKSFNRLHAGEMVISQPKAWEGAIAVIPADFEGWFVSPVFSTFRAKPDRADIGFVDWYCKRACFWDELERRSRGMGARRNSVSPEQFLSCDIPLPPLSEQRRIVAKIEHLASKIEEARGLRANTVAEAEALERSVLDSVYHERTRIDGVARLETVCKNLTDGTHLTPVFHDEGVPFIFVGNVSTGRLHFDGSKHVTPDYFASLQTSRKPERGDVLYSAVGATLGVPVVVDTDREFCFQRHIAIIKPDHETVSPEFLRHMLRSATVFDLAWKSTTGSAQPTIPLRGIRALPVPLPPLPEQRRIVAYLDDLQAKVDQLKTLQAQTAAELDALLPSILDRAFRGEL